MRHRTSRSAWPILALLPLVSAVLVPGVASATSVEASSDRQAVDIVSRMTLAEKIGQLFVVEINGDRAAPAIRATWPRTGRHTA
jgi:hypothetical protein